MAPELLLGFSYSGFVVDLFSAGIILFVMYSGTPAFLQALPNDQHYKKICTNKHNIFWKAHARGKPGGMKFFSEEFKDLINSMLAFDPKKRLSIDDIKAHSWYKGKVPKKK
jgi:serine/threonine protein kinase